jgi:hypothetical protein
MVSAILVDTITPRPEPLQATPHYEQAPVAVRLRMAALPVAWSSRPAGSIT